MLIRWWPYNGIQASFAALLLVTLAACTGGTEGTADSRPEPTNIAHLMIDEEIGRFETYQTVLGNTDGITPTIDDLPIGRLNVGGLPPGLGWMGKYDFDTNKRLDFGEMTMAWVAKALELRVGRSYSPLAIKTFLPAELGGPTLSLKSLGSIQISLGERQFVRALLEESGGADLLSSAERALVDASGGEATPGQFGPTN